MPPDSSRRWTVVKPANGGARASRRRRQVRHALGQVPVGGRIGQQPADAGHHLAEVHAVSPADHGVGRGGDVEQGDAPARADDPSSSSKNAPSSTRLRSEAARRPVERRPGPGARGCRPGPAAPAAVGQQHPEREVDRHRPQPWRQLHAQVAGAGGRGRRPANRLQVQRAHGQPPPADVEPERHQTVDEVVARAMASNIWRTACTLASPWGGGRRPTVRGRRPGSASGGVCPAAGAGARLRR